MIAARSEHIPLLGVRSRTTRGPDGRGDAGYGEAMLMGVTRCK